MLSKSDKTILVEEAHSSRAKDEIIQQTYGDTDNWQGGCLVACAIRGLARRKGITLTTDDHEGLAALLGEPVWVQYLADCIFEALPKAEAADFVVQWTERKPAERDLDRLWHPYMASLFDGPMGLLELDLSDEVRALCVRAADMHRRAERGDYPPQKEVKQHVEAMRAVWDARAMRDAWAVRAMRAVWDARAMRDAWAVRAVWDARAMRDAWAVWAVRDAWAVRGNRGRWGQAQRDTMFELFDQLEANPEAFAPRMELKNA